MSLKREEFTCKCKCGFNNLEFIFFKMLKYARELSDTPYIINSGCRCEEHNIFVGSTSENHREGQGADIRARRGPERGKILKGLYSAGFERIGIHSKFIHVDFMNKVESCWLY